MCNILKLLSSRFNQASWNLNSVDSTLRQIVGFLVSNVMRWCNEFFTQAMTCWRTVRSPLPNPVMETPTSIEAVLIWFTPAPSAVSNAEAVPRPRFKTRCASLPMCHISQRHLRRHVVRRKTSISLTHVVRAAIGSHPIGHWPTRSSWGRALWSAESCGLSNCFSVSKVIFQYLSWHERVQRCPKNVFLFPWRQIFSSFETHCKYYEGT